MIIRVADLASGRRHYEFELSAAALCDVLGERPDLTGMLAGRVSLDAELIYKTVNLTGKVEIEAGVACARCTREFEVSIRLPLKAILARDEGNANPLGVEGEGFAYYDGERVDLLAQALDAAGLLFPSIILCDPECKGLCSGCGADLNEVTCRCRENR